MERKERMTKEEAISLLKQVNKILINSNSWLENTHEPLNQAFGMAIKALEKKCHNENRDYDSCDQFVCSNCGIELQDWHAVERSEDGDITFHEYEFKYCPNCGAEME